ncbi:uncharacterized protein [Diabrotica undecimpunctata]|uniref:uncharacterized protein n=1 Tax=Diabrotica undecimpunctata TaxID=50387 RepID=UPI003B634D28
MEDALIQAVNAVENKEIGVNAAAKAYQIPKTTLKRRIKKQKFTKDSLGFSSILGRVNEQKIVCHIKKLQAHRFTPYRDSVRSMAFELAEELKLPQKFNKETRKASYDWLNFLLKNPTLTIRKSEGVSVCRAKGIKTSCMEEYFKLLESVILENNLVEKPGHIFNMDETGLQLNKRPGNVVAIKGSKNVTSITSGKSTVEGTFLPPYCIMKSKNLKVELNERDASWLSCKNVTKIFLCH